MGRSGDCGKERRINFRSDVVWLLFADTLFWVYLIKEKLGDRLPARHLLYASVEHISVV